MASRTSQRPLIGSAICLGVGLGGFVDGIVFHQILQSHSMLSARLPPSTLVNLEINMFWDGLFHVFCWLMCLVGLALLWRTAQRPTAPLITRTLIGGMFAGWGLFNLIEGVINHHILHLHHVVESDEHLLYDLLFLGSGVLFCGVGWLLIQGGHTVGPEPEVRQ